MWGSWTKVAPMPAGAASGVSRRATWSINPSRTQLSRVQVERDLDRITVNKKEDAADAGASPREVD